MNTVGIYKIKSISKPDRCYVGSAVNIGKRWWTHLYEFRLNNHKNGRLQNHYNKYGETDFEFSVLLRCNKNDLIKNEQYFIDLYMPFFNICKTAGNRLGSVCSEQTKEKLRQMSQSSRDGIRDKLKGKKISKEICMKISIGNKGKKKPKRTAEHIAKLAMANLKITKEIHEYIIHNIDNMTQKQIAKVFGLHQSTISLHLKNHAKK